MLTDEDIDSTLEEVLGANLKSGLDYSQFKKVMDILEDIMVGREEDIDDEEEDGDDDDDDDDDDPEPLPVRGKGKTDAPKSSSKDKASKKVDTPVQTFSPGQGFGRPPAPPPTKGKKAAGKKMSAADEAASLSQDLYDSLRGKVPSILAHAVVVILHMR